MKIIIDANRIIAALVKQSTTRDILFDGKFEFVTPDHSITEINNHKEELQRKTNLTSEEFDVLLALIFENIIILPAETYSQFMDECKNEISDIDDAPYLAACLASRAEGIWSHDPHILEQKKVKVFTNIDMLRLSKL